MRENEKMRPVVTVLGMGVRGNKGESWRRNSTIYCKNFSKYHNVPPVQ
jgi:hypothetical protein